MRTNDQLRVRLHEIDQALDCQLPRNERRNLNREGERIRVRLDGRDPLWSIGQGITHPGPLKKEWATKKAAVNILTLLEDTCKRVK